MALTTVMIHATPTAFRANAAVRGQLSIEVHSAHDSYSDVTFMTGDPVLAKLLADTFQQYMAHKDAAADYTTEDRTREELANGDGIDTPDDGDDDADTFDPEDN